MSRGPEVLIIIHAQRRVFDTGYYESLNAPNMELIADDTVTSVKGDKVYTKGGRELRADVIALATGFKVRDCESGIHFRLRQRGSSCPALWLKPTIRCPSDLFSVTDLFPLKIYNSEGVSLQDLLNKTKVKTYQSTLISGFENFFWLMGPK